MIKSKGSKIALILLVTIGIFILLAQKVVNEVKRSTDEKLTFLVPGSLTFSAEETGTYQIYFEGNLRAGASTGGVEELQKNLEVLADQFQCRINSPSRKTVKATKPSGGARVQYGNRVSIKVLHFPVTELGDHTVNCSFSRWENKKKIKFSIVPPSQNPNLFIFVPLFIFSLSIGALILIYKIVKSDDKNRMRVLEEMHK